MAEGGEVEMDSGNAQSLSRCHIERSAARRDRLGAVDVEHRARLRRRELERGHMQDIAPDHHRVASGTQ